MTDVSYWKCPNCGYVVSAESVVDAMFWALVREHRLHFCRATGNS